MPRRPIARGAAKSVNTEKDTMQTTHSLIISDSRTMAAVDDQSIDLVVTSPPYPMIQMWDGLFSSLSPNVKIALDRGEGDAAFEAMHVELDKVWEELFRALKPGCFACVNIGDATRSVRGEFRLYSNHSRIITSFERLGFHGLPLILWRKQTNAPNKFMGSGMLPSGAYVTLEHEYILVFRKGPKKEFKTPAQKAARMKSAYFWEERNRWFSDMWDFKGASQTLDAAGLRTRSAAFPLELPYRLINMFSLYEETVLDPFMGSGATALAAMAGGRGSIGVEIDEAFSGIIAGQAAAFVPFADTMRRSRMASHAAFVAARTEKKGPLRYKNSPHGFPVVTRQETGMQVYTLKEIDASNPGAILASYDVALSLIHI